MKHVFAFAVVAVVALAACGAPVDVGVDDVRDGVVDPVAAADDEFGSLSGSLCNPHTQIVVADAQIELRWGDDDGEVVVVEGRSDADGAYAIDGVRAGTVVATFRSDGFQLTKALEIVADAENLFSLSCDVDE